MEVAANNIVSATIEATVTRADGTVEHLGVLDSYERGWFRTLLNKLFPRHSRAAIEDLERGDWLDDGYPLKD